MDYLAPAKGMPNQLVPLSQKIGNGEEVTQWQKECMNFFDSIASYQSNEKIKDFKNYQLFNGHYDFTDYEYITKPFGEGWGELPAKLRHFPICSVPIKKCIGEQSKMPWTFFCKAEDESSKNEYDRTQSDLLHQYVQSSILQELKNKGANIQDQQQVQAMTPEYIQEYMDRSFTPTAEIYGNTTLNYLKKKQDLSHKFLRGFNDALIVGKEFYLSTIVNGDPYFKILNPLYVFYDKSADTEYVEDGDYAGIREFMTPSQVIDLLGAKMTETQVKQVMNYSRAFGPIHEWNSKTGIDSIETTYTNSQTNMIGFQDLAFPGPYSSIQQMFESYFSNGQYFSLDRLPVTMAYWKSKQKIGFLHYFDEQDEEQIMKVDETYSPNKNKGEWVEWQWINQIWEGVKIGTDLYIDIHPSEYQGASPTRIYDRKLPITGIIYNGRNSLPTSMLDEMKPYQEAYNIYMHKLEEDFNSEIGKILFMSLRHIPKRKGWDEKRWLWYLKALKIAWVDDSIENMKGQSSNFSHFQAADASLGDQIQQKINVLEFLKEECNYIAGITRGRLGSNRPSDTATGVNAMVQASYDQTEMYFRAHNDLIQHALTILLHTAQSAYSKGKQIRNILDDMSNAFIDIDGDKFTLADIGVFVTNSTEDQRIREALRGLAQPALQAGADLSDVAQIESTESIAEIREILEKIKKQKVAQQQAQLQQEQQQAQMEQAQQDKMMQNENMNKELDRQNAINLELLKAESFSKNPELDANANGIPDLLDISRFASEQAESAYERLFKQKQLKQDDEQHSKELDLKKQELQLKKRDLISKEKQHNSKLNVEKQNIKNDLLIEKIRSKNRNKTK